MFEYRFFHGRSPEKGPLPFSRDFDLRETSLINQDSKKQIHEYTYCAYSAPGMYSCKTYTILSRRCSLSNPSLVRILIPCLGDLKHKTPMADQSKGHPGYVALFSKSPYTARKILHIISQCYAAFFSESQLLHIQPFVSLTRLRSPEDRKFTASPDVLRWASD